MLDAVIITLDDKSRRATDTRHEVVDVLGFDDKHVHYQQAVVGKQLDDATVRRLVTPRAYHELRRGRYDHAALSGLGSLGCFLSHAEAWRRCVASGRDLAIVEDDLKTVDGARDLFWSSYAKMPRDAVLRAGFMSHRLANEKTLCGTQFYVVTPQSAATLLAHCSPIEAHVDWYMVHLEHAGLLHVVFTPKNVYDFSGILSARSTLGHTSLLTQRPDRWKVAVVVAVVSLLAVTVAVLATVQAAQRR